MTLVPPAIQRAQREISSLIKRTGSAWPEKLITYPSGQLATIIRGLDASMGYLSMAITGALQDPLVQERADLVAAGNAAITEMHRYRQLLEIPLGQAAGAAHVENEHLRAASLDIMARTLALWQGLNKTHDAAFSWMSDERAGQILEGYRSVFESVALLPGASRPLPAMANWGVGLGLLGIVGTGVWMAMRGGSGQQYLPEEQSEPLELPRGIHVVGTTDHGDEIITGAKTPKDVFAAVKGLTALRSQAADQDD